MNPHCPQTGTGQERTRHGNTFSRAVVLVQVRFPFSDLSESKLRPAFVLADVGRGDFLLCQITSRRYGDSTAIELLDNDFKQRSLKRRSYIRPDKLVTANQTLVEREVGSLKVAQWQTVVTAIESILRKSIPEH